MSDPTLIYCRQEGTAIELCFKSAEWHICVPLTALKATDLAADLTRMAVFALRVKAYDPANG